MVACSCQDEGTAARTCVCRVALLTAPVRIDRLTGDFRRLARSARKAPNERRSDELWSARTSCPLQRPPPLVGHRRLDRADVDRRRRRGQALEPLVPELLDPGPVGLRSEPADAAR